MSPLSSFNIVIYFGLIPLILVAGIVMAVRKRDELGSRAARQLIIGAVLLLLTHALSVMRPLLHRLIFVQDQVFASWIPDAVELLSLAQLILQAAGLGLIFASVFAAARFRTATDVGPAPDDHDENAADTQGRPPVPAPASSRLSLSIAAVAVVLVLTAVAAWVIRTAQANEVPPWRVTEDQQAQQCLNNHTTSAQVKGRPVERMLLRKDGGWLRVYVSEPDNWIVACQGGPDALMGAFATIMDDGHPTGKIRFFGGYDSVLKGHILLGKMPNGATTIEARLTTGQIVRGEHDGDIFVIWAPGGIAAEGAQVTASTQDGAIIATAAAPAEKDYQ